MDFPRLSVKPAGHVSCVPLGAGGRTIIMRRMREWTARVAIGATLGFCAVACSGASPVDFGGNPDGGNTKGDDGATMGDSGNTDGDSAITTGEGGSSADCANATPLIVLGQPSGYVTCPDGAVERPLALACPQPTSGGADCSNSDGQCTSDAECQAMGKGICSQAHHLQGLCGCFPGLCFQDSDCAAGSICECTSEGYGRCLPSTCTSDASCPAGQACASATAVATCTMQTQFACTTPQDKCLGDADCGSGSVCTLEGSVRGCTPQCVQHPSE
jgi:hypothetical protein